MSGALQVVFQNQRSFNKAPVNTAVPTVSGTVSIGSVLTSTTGTWTGNPTPTYTYQWQRGTTNISGATSSTYTIQLGDGGYTLRCVVTATNIVASVSANSANTTTVALPAIGSALGGGYYAGQISTSANGVATHALIVAPFASGHSFSKKYKNVNSAVTGADSMFNGAQNTADMVSTGDATVYPAAWFCDQLVIGGYSDWYMPSRYEMGCIYYHMKPYASYPNWGTSQGTTNGTNPYSVPTRTTGYGYYDPSITTASAFIEPTGTEYWYRSGYWSSTDDSTNTLKAWYVGFGDGEETNIENKNIALYVRGIRKIAL
jgi:hypothetical protein